MAARPRSSRTSRAASGRRGSRCSGHGSSAGAAQSGRFRPLEGGLRWARGSATGGGADGHTRDAQRGRPGRSGPAVRGGGRRAVVFVFVFSRGGRGAKEESGVLDRRDIYFLT